MRHAGGGLTADRTSRHTVTPSPSGSRTSRIATSGRRAGMRAIACHAVPASPTNWMSSCLEELRDAAADDLVIVEREHGYGHGLAFRGRSGLSRRR
jgi:hypothetical protein